MKLLINAFILLLFVGCTERTTYKNEYAKNIADSVTKQLIFEGEQQIDNYEWHYKPDGYDNDSSAIQHLTYEIDAIKTKNGSQMFFEIECEGYHQQPDIKECSFIINDVRYEMDIVDKFEGITSRKRSDDSDNLYLTETIKVFVEPEMINEILRYGVKIIAKGDKEYVTELLKSDTNLAFVINY